MFLVGDVVYFVGGGVWMVDLLAVLRGEVLWWLRSCWWCGVWAWDDGLVVGCWVRFRVWWFEFELVGSEVVVLCFSYGYAWGFRHRFMVDRFVDDLCDPGSVGRLEGWVRGLVWGL